jgi:hypothetical protein
MLPHPKGSLAAALLAIAPLISLVTADSQQDYVAAGPAGVYCSVYNATDPVNASNQWYPGVILQKDSNLDYYVGMTDYVDDWWNFQVALYDTRRHLKAFTDHGKPRQFKIKMLDKDLNVVTAYWADQNMNCWHDSSAETNQAVKYVSVLEKCNKKCPKDVESP